MTIRISLPRLPAGAIANLMGLVGLLAVVLAIGGLTGNWWWSLLSGGFIATALAYVAQTHSEAERASRRPRLVPEDARSA